MAGSSEPIEFTAVIRKGERFYVALCPELDVVSQGVTIEEALEQLREAVTLYLEEMGLPEGATGPAFVARFGVRNAQAS